MAFILLLPYCSLSLSPSILFPHQNEEQLVDNDPDHIFNDTNTGSMYADLTVSTDASGARTSARKRSSPAGVGSPDDTLDPELAFGEHELVIRGTRLVLPTDHPAEVPTTVTLPPPPSPPSADPRRHRL